MYCRECGKELKEGKTVCENCGKKVENNDKANRKIKFKVADVVNADSVLASTNRVAYIANGWALQVRKRGENIAIIIVIVFFFIAMGISDGEFETAEFLSTFGSGVLYSIITAMVFNTVSFIIRMGAEVIQLLEDIKQKKET